MESLFNNKPLLYSLAFSGTAITGLASGVIPDIADQFEIVPLPTEVKCVYVYGVPCICDVLDAAKNSTLNALCKCQDFF